MNHAGDPELVEAHTVQVGDAIMLRHVGDVVVSSISTIPDTGQLVIVYFRHGETAYENKASAAKGASRTRRLIELSLRPLQPHDLLLVERGRKQTADKLRAELDRATGARSARLEARRGKPG